MWLNDTSIKTEIMRMDKNDLIKCYLQETQFKYNDRGRLKVKDGKRYTMQILIKGKLDSLI